MTENQLVLNQSKTKGLLFGTRQKLDNTDVFVLQLQGKNIERVSKFNYLGTVLDEQLMWKEHIDMVCSKVKKRLGLLSRIRSCLTPKAANCVYRSVISLFLTIRTLLGEQCLSVAARTCRNCKTELHA